MQPDDDAVSHSGLVSFGDVYPILETERGIRTFETALRNTLDLAVVPLLNELTHLPVVIDPSHGTGKRSLVPPVARAAVAIGADAIMTEVHPCPEEAWSDGPQSLRFEDFDKMMVDLQPYIKLRQQAAVFRLTLYWFHFS